MKKLMVMAMMLCAAIAAQATASWSIKNADAYNGYKVYVMNVGSGSTSLDDNLVGWNNLFLTDTYWNDVGATTWKGYYATLSSVYSASTSTIANGAASAVCAMPGTIMSALFFVCKDGITPGGEYILAKTLYADSSAPGVFDFSKMETLQSGTFNTDAVAVPEPTSGMLLLLGFAGLALKRKRLR